MTGPKRRRTTSMQTRSASATGTSEETSVSSSPSRESSPTTTSRSGHSLPDIIEHAGSSITPQPSKPGNATRTRGYTTTTTTTPTRRQYSRSGGGIPETSEASSLNQLSSPISSASNATSYASETSSRRTNSTASQIDNATGNDVVLWIRENYEMMPNSNVPRSGIYEHYRHYCALRNRRSVNAATFGKLIRVAFPSISTRRLGNRGQSKYQYCNIQRRDVDTTVTGDASTETNISILESNQGILSSQPSTSTTPNVSLQDSVEVASVVFADLYADNQNEATYSSTPSNQATTSALLIQPQQYHRRNHHNHQQEDDYFNRSSNSVSGARGFPSYRLPPPISFTTTPSSPSTSAPTATLPSTPKFMSGSELVSDFSASSSRSVVPSTSRPSTTRPPPPSIILPPVDLSTSAPISASQSSSSSSSSSSGISMSSSNFSYFRATNSSWDRSGSYAKFAESYNRHCRNIYEAIRTGNFVKLQEIYDVYYNNMPAHHRSLMNNEEMIESIWRWDCVLYDTLIADLLPKVDTPTTERMMSGLHYCTKFLPQYLNDLLQSYPTTLKKKKVDVAGIFAAKMRRHLTLNQFAIAAGDVIRQPALLEAMKSDWKNLNIGAILDHVLWVCDCRNDTMEQILGQDVAQLLTCGSTLEQWMKWEEKLIDKFLPPLTKIHEVKSIDEYLTQAKQFVLKWKMYSGLVMQQFYIKNVASIGSFKTLQFFFDDLVLYHVEERIANMNADINKRLSPARASAVNFPFSSGSRNASSSNPSR